VRYADGLEDGLSCSRDIPFLKALGVNAILVDVINPNADHSGCMTQLQTAGIYVLANLGGPNEQIMQLQTWDRDLQKRFFGVAENLMHYSNLLGFYTTGTVITVPFVKAAIRDLKQFLKSKGQARIPVGYSSLIRGKDTSDVVNCGATDTSVDFMALELDPLCSNLNLTVEAIETVAEQYLDYSIPLMFLGLRCVPQVQGNIAAIPSIYQPEVSKSIAGAFMFSYFGSQRSNQTGNQNRVESKGVLYANIVFRNRSYCRK
jgi:hypothetical protein